MTQSGSNKGPNKKVANSLVALSSAAVLAIYTAGYLRTRPAAERLVLQAVERRPAVQVPTHSETPIADFRPAARDIPAAPSAATTSAPSRAKREAVVAAKQTAPPEPTAATTEIPSTPAAPLPSEIPPPAAVPVVVTAAESSPPVAEKVDAPVALPAAPSPSAWKDGTYHGWGTSRHGDIEAAVVIAGGRIVSATISECRTRYSCDVIDKLPPQVAQRQSPDVDTVSSATQSADAFYFAVVEALSKAK